MKYFKFICIALALTACAQEKKPDESNSLRANPQNNHGGSSSTVADCSLKFSPSGLCFSYYWETTPTEDAEGSIIFKIFHANALDQTVVMNSIDQDPNVFLWMPSMGHGSQPVKLDRLDTGTYRVSKVYFIMPGQWEIHFQIKELETVKDEIIIPVTY